MAMISSNDGTTQSVDLTHAKTMECEECQCKAFKQTLIAISISAFSSIYV